MKTKIHLFRMAVCLALLLCVPALAQWTEPAPLTEVNTEYKESSPFLSYDGLTFYFTRRETNTYYHDRIYKATREQPFGPFTSIAELSELNSPGRNVIWPWVSPDSLRMYYSKSVARLIFSERASIYDSWPQGTDITELNALGKIYDPSLTADELTIFFHSPYLPGSLGNDIWMAERTDRTSPFGNVRNVAEINSASEESGAFISPDGLILFFTSNRNGQWQIFKATRQSTEEPFGDVEHLSIFDTPVGTSKNPSISSDGKTFYFYRVTNETLADIWVSYLQSQAVNVDIKPGSCPNPLNLSSRGVLPVAILGTEELDVDNIDPASVRLEGIAPIRSHYEDVATPAADGNECECTTAGPDGYLDICLKFETEAVAEQIINSVGQLNKGDVLELFLTGALIDQTPIEGTDCVKVVGKVPRSLAAKKSDLNKDGIVNFLDIGMMSEYWLETATVEY